MAASKSASRKSASKKSTPRKSAAKKAAKTPKSRAAAKKTAKKTARKAVVRRATNPAIQDLDARIAIIRNNLRELVEQAAGFSGASNEELMSNRIAEQEAKLERLKKQRERLS